MTDISRTAGLLVGTYPWRVPRVLLVTILDRDSIAAQQARAGDWLATVG
jgi:hypothetical protein